MTGTLTARGQDRCTGSNVSATATAICPMLYTPRIAVVQNCPPNPMPMGGVYVFTGFVTNTGDAILTNVVVFSSEAGQNLPLLGPLDLAPGQSEQYTGSVIVASNICAVTITAASQETCRGTWITNTTACPVATTPGIAITQSCPPNPVSPGGLLTYSGSVRNAGNITLTDIVVTNDRSGAAPVLTVASLAPGASATFTGSYTAPASGEATSTATVRASSLCNVAVTNSASSACPLLTSPGIAITKACPPQPVAAGGTLVFTGTVTNTGTVTLTNVLVVDNEPAPNTPVLGPITLAPGAGTNFAASYTVALDACASTDTLIATGNDNSTGAAVTSSVSATCPIITIPSIAITLNCPPSPVSPGGLLTYSGSVRNAGSIALIDIVVTNDRNGAAPVLTLASLAPGSSAPFSGSYTVPASGEATSTATVRASSLCNVAVTNSASSACPLLTSPGIAITKACPPQPVAAGGTLVFTGTVTNTGTVTLTNVLVVDNEPAAEHSGVGADYTGTRRGNQLCGRLHCGS